ncbi:YHYH domain-containing protein [Clostridium sp. E02]|uniref:YHYH domain-containing protein n=1 Tax=Clostridium sp. E02 TaxID=2487134 RepID=UPI001FAAB503|nr:YHYH domain-containing protein [Clostridium sp. E02]
MNKKAISKKSDFLTKRIKKIAIFVVAILIIGSMGTSHLGGVLVVEAHSGRTDSQGGHHDYKNKSGLGSYHYHHGQKAHLHPNGVCPYGYGGSSSEQTSSSTSDKIEAPALKAEDFKLIFDSTFYYTNNEDLQSTVGNDEQRLLDHFVNFGMAEGRKGCSDFDVMIYKSSNTDLETAYGDDLKKYYEHYRNSGYNENRIHN